MSLVTIVTFCAETAIGWVINANEINPFIPNLTSSSIATCRLSPWIIFETEFAMSLTLDVPMVHGLWYVWAGMNLKITPLFFTHHHHACI